MKYKEVQQLSPEELSERLEQERVNLRKLRFAHALSALENPMKLRATRRLIARLTTQEQVLKTNQEA